MKTKKLIFENTSNKTKSIKVKALGKGDRPFIAVFNEQSVKGTKKGACFVFHQKYDDGYNILTPLTLPPVDEKLQTPATVNIGDYTTVSTTLPPKSKLTLVCKPYNLTNIKSMLSGKPPKHKATLTNKKG